MRQLSTSRSIKVEMSLIREPAIAQQVLVDGPYSERHSSAIVVDG